MEVLYSRCCGLDVHKSSVSACVLIREAGRSQKKYGRYGAMTRDLEELARWLRELGVTHAAMESTGVHWKPVWNVLEGRFHLLLVNAQHVKNVPGHIGVVPFYLLLILPQIQRVDQTLRFTITQINGQSVQGRPTCVWL